MSNTIDNSDEDTNGSFEIVDKVTESSDSDNMTKEERNDEVESKPQNEENDEDKWEDVLGSGHLLRKVIKKGQDIRPDRRDICEIKYECRLDGKVIEWVDSMKILVSDAELIQGLDLIIPLMYVGEISEVIVGPRFAYGSKGVKDEPIEIYPNATLHYTIELLSVSPEPEVETMNVETRKELGIGKKLRGNWWFVREEYTFAIQCYKRALEYLDYTESDDVEQTISKTEADKLIDERINVYNNLAVAQLKVNIPDDALHSAEVVLKLQPDNVKALFRKGMALVEKGERKDAARCLKKALELDPQNTRLQNELQKLQKLLTHDAKTERILYKKMFEPSKSEKEDRTTLKQTWIKLGVFVGSIAVALVGVVIYKYSLD